MGRIERLLIALSVLALILAACGGGDTDSQSSDEDQPVAENGGGDSADDGVMSSSFGVGDLPSDFRSDLAPDSFSAGMYAELGSVKNANFEVDQSFDDVVAAYTAKLGAPLLVGDAGERLAQWIIDEEWSVSVIEDTPTLVAVSTSG